jgi:hypothetical protein
MMRPTRFSIAIAALTLSASAALAQTALGPDFTYQGRLVNGTTPVDGPTNLAFRLYDAPVAGNLLGTQISNATPVSDGLFTIQLNSANQFGTSAFNGQARWLEIDVNGTTMLPRQAITAAPYALGLRLPLAESLATSADSINITQTGTGDAAQFNIVNPANVGEALEAHTDGSGDSIQSVTTGTGRAGYFQISNAANAQPALYVTSNGTNVGLWSIKTAGAADAIHGQSAAGNIGLLGTNVYGVRGDHGSTGNFGYIGGASYGVYGEHSATGNSGQLGTSSYGVRGIGVGSDYGMYGTSTDSYGVRGFSTNESGVSAGSTNWDGMWGHASTSARAGVYGDNDTAGGYGVFGRNTSGTTDSVGYLGGTYGAYGVAPGGGGFFDTPSGFTSAGCFVGGSNVGDALFAAASGDGVSGRFQSDGANNSDGVLIIHNNRGNCLDINNSNPSATSSRLADMTGTGASAFGVFISVPAGHTGLSVVSGTKNCVTRTSQGPRFMYCEEASEVWFTDYGFGELVNGRAKVKIDPLMAETVNLDERYYVFVQSNSEDCRGLAIVNRSATGFDVVELNGGSSSGEFSYRLVAKRRGYEALRLEHCPQAELDPNLYPERRLEWERSRRGAKPEPTAPTVERAQRSAPRPASE